MSSSATVHSGKGHIKERHTRHSQRKLPSLGRRTQERIIQHIVSNIRDIFEAGSFVESMPNEQSRRRIGRLAWKALQEGGKALTQKEIEILFRIAIPLASVRRLLRQSASGKPVLSRWFRRHAGIRAARVLLSAGSDEPSEVKTLLSVGNRNRQHEWENVLHAVLSMRQIQPFVLNRLRAREGDFAKALLSERVRGLFSRVLLRVQEGSVKISISGRKGPKWLRELRALLSDKRYRNYALALLPSAK